MAPPLQEMFGRSNDKPFQADHVNTAEHIRFSCVLKLRANRMAPLYKKSMFFQALNCLKEPMAYKLLLAIF